MERNQAKKRQNEKENEKIMKDYEYRSKLNRSRINTERRAGESEENYQLRIQAYQPSMDEVRREAYLWKYEDLKNSLKEIIKNPAIIEQILNGLSREEIVEFDKVSTFLKSEFVKYFGTKTDKLNAREIVMFFKDRISTLSSSDHSVAGGRYP